MVCSMAQNALGVKNYLYLKHNLLLPFPVASLSCLSHVPTVVRLLSVLPIVSMLFRIDVVAGKNNGHGLKILTVKLFLAARLVVRQGQRTPQ